MQDRAPDSGKIINSKINSLLNSELEFNQSAFKFINLKFQNWSPSLEELK